MAQLVDVIDSRDIKLIDHFVGKARNIVWLNIAIHELLWAIRLDAVLLLAFGTTNQFYYLISPTAALAVLSVAPVWSVIAAVLKRPGRHEAACIVDDRYATHSLFVTAEELLQAPVRLASEFCPWIIRQAARTATLKLKEQSLARLCLLYQPPWLEIGLLVVGIFLILQPAPIDAVTEKSVSVGDNVPSEMLPQSSKTDLFEEIRKAALNNEPNVKAIPNSSDELSVSRHEMASSAHANEIRPDGLADTALTVEETTTKSSEDLTADSNINSSLERAGIRPARGIGVDADTDPMTASYEQHPNAQVKYVEVPVNIGRAVSDNKGSVPYVQDYRGPEDKIEFNPSLPPKIEKNTLPLNNYPTFVQQRYASLYFKRIHQKK